jgi:hypothetical protein
MKYLKLFFVLLLIISAILTSCSDSHKKSEETEERYEDYALNMNTDYVRSKDLLYGNGQSIKVVILIGQSNASGSSIVSYLEKSIDKSEFEKAKSGYQNVLINYCIDDHNATSNGEFIPVDLTCGAAEGFFGPEVGMASVLSEAFKDETVVILKYTMSGYSLNHHWLFNGQRASIYNAFVAYVDFYISVLYENGYLPELSAVCWMQGESDTSEYKAERYYGNQTAFVSYLREDLKKYTSGGSELIYFIDAGISSSPYCEPGYPTVNEAKRRFSELSDKNIYFSTIDLGFTTMNEPDYEPDLGHYDAKYEFLLGQRFGEEIVKIYLSENKN